MKLDYNFLFNKLFPIPRCITGNGYRESLIFLSRYVPFKFLNYKSGKNIFAICLGMQILLNESSEDSKFKGLNILQGDVIKIKTKKLPLPHIGWNKIICNNKKKI